MPSPKPGVRFSSQYNVVRTDTDDWFDLVLLQDTAMAVDPYLVFEDQDPRWAHTRGKVIDFFDMVRKLAARDQSRRAAINMLRFREPFEVCLGVSTKSPYGTGIGPKIARPMAGLLTDFSMKFDNPCSDFELIQLFEKGVAFDGISDMMINILKSDLIEYTQGIAKKHGIAMEVMQVTNARWTKFGRWMNVPVALPINPVLTNQDKKKRKQPLILVPERWLREVRRPDDDDVTSWFAESEAAASLRDTLNRDLLEELAKRENRARLVTHLKNHPNVVQAWIDHLATLERQAYDTARDSKGVVRYPELGVELFGLASHKTTKIDPAKDFCGWLGWLVERFQHAIEQEGGWRALWMKGKQQHVNEDVTQSVANIFFRAFCNHLNIQISREVEVGRGWVDFHISAGKTKRGLIEVKHMDHSRILHAANQLKTYCDADEIDCGYLLCIGFTSAHLSTARNSKRSKLEEACEEQSVGGRILQLAVIDATPKVSASLV